MSKPYQDSSCSPVAEPLPGKGAVMSGAGGAARTRRRINVRP